MGNSLNIIIVAALDLPEGGGDSTRLKTLAGAVKSAGHEVRILLENPSGTVDEKLLQTEGVVNNVPFRYILGDVSPLKGGHFFTSKYKAVRMLLEAVRTMHSKKKIDVLWFNQLAFHVIYPLTKLCKKLGIKTVHSYEDDRVKGNGLKRRLIYTNQTLADKYTTRNADAIITISHYLKNKYTRFTKGKVPVTVIPTVVDIEEWNVGPEPVNPIPVLLYYGGFFGFDDIEKMILAVKILKESGQKIKFYVLGYNRKKPEYMEEIAQLVKKTNLNDEVLLKGFTPHAALKQYLKEANLLIGLRRDHEWSQSGLSTKLSEYLSTGRMVICSSIGDNTRYLENEKSACMLPPACTVEELADTIRKALKDDAARIKIGAGGREVARNEFDVKVIRKKINQILYSIT